MGTLWYALVAVMLAMYVLLDGFDLGVGIVHVYVARTDRERRQVLRSIGPVWDGNEVWLLAAGGTLYFAFPVLYASAFSGFYLPLMIVLWLLIGRGISIEFRSHISGPVWAPFWDGMFSLSSLLLAIFYGAALGNVVRGVPLDAKGYFFEALWTNFDLHGETGILDWYTILVGLAAFAALTLHGALWLALKTSGPVHDRARRLACRVLWGVLALTGLVTFVTFRVQPLVPANLAAHLWGAIFPALAVGGLAVACWYLLRPAAPGSDRGAFFGSCAYLLGMLTSVAFGLYPYVLPASTNPAFSLTVSNAKAANYGLSVGLGWWIMGMLLATGYFILVYRHFAGKVDIHNSHEGY